MTTPAAAAIMLLEWGGTMVIDVSVLRRSMGREERHAFDLVLEPVEAGGGRVEFTRPARVQLHLLNAGEAILATVDVAAEVTADCARCLEPFSFPLGLRYEEEYREGRAPAQGAAGAPVEADLDEGTATVSYYSGDAIDFGPDVREHVILALPMKAVCREDCRGLCPRCGANLNRGPCKCPPAAGDPRLAVLGDILGKTRGGTGRPGGRAGEEDD